MGGWLRRVGACDVQLVPSEASLRDGGWMDVLCADRVAVRQTTDTTYGSYDMAQGSSFHRQESRRSKNDAASQEAAGTTQQARKEQAASSFNEWQAGTARRQSSRSGSGSASGQVRKRVRDVLRLRWGVTRRAAEMQTWTCRVFVFACLLAALAHGPPPPAPMQARACSSLDSTARPWPCPPQGPVRVVDVQQSSTKPCVVV
jgi:hypothetical protein